MEQKKTKYNLPKIDRKVQVLFVALTLIFTSLGLFYINTYADKVSYKSNGSQYTTSSLPKETPNFPTISPSGKGVAGLGGWTRISPPGSDPVYAFADKINNISISISEQPLPEDMKQNPSESIRHLAESFSANEKITISDIMIYIGTSAKGPQSAIFYKNNLLILIKSTAKISNDNWVNYVSNLR